MKTLLKSLAPIFALSISLSAFAAATPTSTCDSSGKLDISNYFVQNNPWNGSKASSDSSQCIYVDGENNGINWGANWHYPDNGNKDVKGYPSIVYGWHWGKWSTGSALPVKVSDNKNIITSWTISPNNMSGEYNSAYDIWLHDTNNPGSKHPQVELMIWLNKTNNMYSAGTYQGQINLGGISWNVYKGKLSNADSNWDYYGFLSASNTNSVSNLNIRDFINYLRDKGWLSNDLYVTSVEAGHEMKYGDGNPNSSNFKVEVH
jgi:hypothetical protein